jgi:hypothetical protein
MKIYHGSTDAVHLPTILDTQRLLDFGKGFYTTTNFEQAQRWAIIKRNRIGNQAEAIVNVYNFDEKLLDSAIFKLRLFKSADEDWLDFIVLNRRSSISHHYDIVMGAVANDTLYQTLTLYETGILTKQETIVRLKVHTLFDQLSFHSLEVLKHVAFENAVVVND